MHLWEKNTDKYKGNLVSLGNYSIVGRFLKFCWLNPLVSNSLSLPFTNFATFKVFSSYFNADSHVETL